MPSQPSWEDLSPLMRPQPWYMRGEVYLSSRPSNSSKLIERLFSTTKRKPWPFPIRDGVQRVGAGLLTFTGTLIQSLINKWSREKRKVCARSCFHHLYWELYIYLGIGVSTLGPSPPGFYFSNCLWQDLGGSSVISYLNSSNWCHLYEVSIKKYPLFVIWFTCKTNSVLHWKMQIHIVMPQTTP